MKIKSQTIMRNLAFLLVLMISLSAKAQVEFLIVNLSDGSAASVALADHPVMKTSDGQFTVEAENLKLSVPISEVVGYSFSEVSAVEETMVTSSHNIDNNHIIFSNMKDGENISIFSMNGMIMAQATTNADGKADINISNFPLGAYIVRTSSSSFKFIKK